MCGGQLVICNFNTTTNTLKGVHYWKEFSEMFIKLKNLKKIMILLIYIFSEFKYLHIVYGIIFWKVVYLCLWY